MIAQLSGTLLNKQPHQVIVDVNGVGYEVHIPLSTFYKAGEVGSSIRLRICTYVREDAFLLFGFESPEEKSAFEHLTSVSGVGPRLAITILSGMSVDELIPAIRQSNLARLCSIPGVGRKTAERLVVELRDKLAKADPEEHRPQAPGLPPHQEDVISALMNLGYPKSAAERAVQRAARDAPAEVSFEELLRKSLRVLSR